MTMNTYLVHFENDTNSWAEYYNADNEAQVMEYAREDLVNDDDWIFAVEEV